MLAGLGLVACAGKVFPESSESYQYSELTGFFTHLLISKMPKPDDSDSLHVYIEGDGMPWINYRIINTDPTPTQPLALALMQRDPSAAIYLGRPCYFSAHLGKPDPQCSAHDWTDGRYSVRVVQSMTAVLKEYLRSNRHEKLVLIGYSGGGVIATMMACEMDMPVRLVTLAANLDVAAWTTFHDYSPLTQSLDPARDFTPCDHVQHLHLVGSKDTVVPPASTQAFFARTGIPQTLIDGADHDCCWLETWPDQLRALDKVIPPTPVTKNPEAQG